MKNYKNNLYLLIILTLTLIFIPGCSRDETQPEPLDTTYTHKTAKIFSHTTSGIISPTNEIQITFVQPEIKNNLVNTQIKENIFTFNPPIAGLAHWKNTRTISFKPNKKLPFRQTYNAAVNYKKLIPKYKNAPPLTFTFTTSGREIADISGNFDLQNPTDPNTLYYEGKISFTEPIPMETAKQALSLTTNSRPMELQWTENEKDRTFAFKTQPFKRAMQTQTFLLTVDKDESELSQTFEKQFTLEPLKDLKVLEIRRFDEGKKPGMEIKFSDLLDPKQDITGLVRVEPLVKFDFKSVGKRILLTGDFSYGLTYSLRISGIRSKWGTVLPGEILKQVDFEDQKPQFSFLSDGLYLPSINEQKIGFKTMNVKNVRLMVKKVFESNLGQFLQSQNIDARKQRNERFYDYDINRVGVTVADKKLRIGETKNQWLSHMLDLKELIPAGEKGIFLFQLAFTKNDMLYSGLTTGRSRYYSGSQYYSNPNSSGYLYRHGTIVKPVIVSDIGLTYKGGGNRHLVFAVNLPDASPLSGVTVTLRTFQDQVIGKAQTDGDGKAVFNDIKEKVFFIEGEKDGQRSMIKPADMGWNTSTFDTGGVVTALEETRAFIYTERGVYRPGDPVHLSVIARNKDNSFPQDHPVTLELYNPKNQLMVKQTSQKAKDGFYSFHFKTKPDDLTGNWRAKILVGGRTIYHTVKIETVVPNRLKVKIEPEKETLTPADNQVKFDLSSKYLFGAPAAFLKAEAAIKLSHRLKTFPKYHGFSFNNEAMVFSPVNTNVFNNKLDSDGKAAVAWKYPQLTFVPSAAVAEITAKVFEKGGRATRSDSTVSIDPYQHYVGLQKPKFKYGYGYSRVGTPVQINTILLNRDGTPTAGQPMEYKIYKNGRYWWWEYNRREDFRVRFKKDKYTTLLTEGKLISKGLPQVITFKPEDRGEYFIEVADISGGHRAGFFISAYYWGDAPSGMEGAGTLTLKSNKAQFRPGDTAEISFPVPKEGTVFVSLEKADQVLRTFVEEANPGANAEQTIRIPVTEEMLPNVYVSVSIIQPLEQAANDRPLRTYGIIPLLVEDPNTRQALRIQMPDRLRPNESFDITVETGDKKPTQLTIAVVDEGLLDLTRFLTPNPWEAFFKKQKLGVRTSDLFAFVIGAHKGDIFRLFSIGGGKAEGYRSSQMEPGKVQRFKPVSLFKGPLETDENGKVNVSFEMPDYIGSVRVMAVSANGGRYGSVAKAVPVKTELMVLPTLPRVMGPGDKFVVPVTVFAMEEKIKNVDVSIAVEGPVLLEGKKSQTLTFDKPGEKDAAFTLLVQPAVGKAAVVITAKGGKFKMEKRTDINIRPYSPRIYSSETKECQPGSTVNITVPDRGITGTNRATVSVMRRARLSLQHRLGWLIRYPYGCIEQTTSAVFPQLYLKDLIKKSMDDESQIDANINEGIQRLRRFQLPSGAFTYWPGARDVSVWGTNYAGHFLAEAKKLGYNVPDELFNGWERFQESRALTTTDDLKSRIYRLYVLALAGKPQMGPMNLLKENQLKKMTNAEKWMLAGAYHLAGSKNAAEAIFKHAALEVAEYTETGGTYGSRVRDLAIILEVLTLFEDWNKADSVYEEVLAEVSGDYWYSTQTLGYSLLALGKYIRANAGDFREEKPMLSGYIKLPGKKKVPFSTDQLKFSLDIEEGFGKDVEVYLDKKTNLERGFVVMEWNGVPMVPDVKEISEKLRLEVEWLDDNGMVIDPARVTQGKTFWGHFRVGLSGYTRSRIEELALVQVLPSGWEIENIRLLNEAVPVWMKKWSLNREEYLDIRDDRIMWFFDMWDYKKSYDFVVKLNAVTAGEFILPPTLFEAMYNNKYKAVKKGRFVRVTSN